MRQRSRPNRSASRTALSSSGAPTRIRHQFDASHPSAPILVAFPPKRDSSAEDRQRLLKLRPRRDYCIAAREINAAACSTETASVLTTRS
jgi:hypothetical protein